jgi:hypothetical protein
MKLARITKPFRSVQVRVTLAGDLNASLERYTQYYEHVHGEAADPRMLIPEIPTPSSMQTVSSSRGHAPLTGTNRDAPGLPPQPTAPPRLNRDFHHSGTD